MTERLFNYNHW